jgi:hypothetical protein
MCGAHRRRAPAAADIDNDRAIVVAHSDQHAGDIRAFARFLAGLAKKPRVPAAVPRRNYRHVVTALDEQLGPHLGEVFRKLAEQKRKQDRGRSSSAVERWGVALSKGRERALDLLPGQRWSEYRERRER